MNSPHFVTDADGKRTGVLLDLETYEQLLEAWEELDDIRAYDAAKARIDAGEEEVIPFEQAMAELDAHERPPAGR